MRAIGRLQKRIFLGVRAVSQVQLAWNEGTKGEKKGLWLNRKFGNPDLFFGRGQREGGQQHSTQINSVPTARMKGSSSPQKGLLLWPNTNSSNRFFPLLLASFGDSGFQHGERGKSELPSCVKFRSRQKPAHLSLLSLLPLSQLGFLGRQWMKTRQRREEGGDGCIV